MQSHCVCSCVCVLWNGSFQPQHLNIPNGNVIIKDNRLFQQNWSKAVIAVPGMWLTWKCDWQSRAEELLSPNSSLSNGRAIREEMEVLEMLGKDVRWGLPAGKHLLINPSFPLWAVPLVLLPGVPSMASLPACFKQEFQAFFGAAAVSWCKNSSQP